MIDLVKNWLGKFAVQLAVGICVGIGASILTASMTLNNLATRVSSIEEKKLPERVITLETTILRHEQALERDFSRHEQMVFELAHKTDDQEKRLTRLETLVSETQRLLGEISADVKSLLRSRK